MKKDIDFNTERRKNTKNEFEKLMNNSANSKTMKNLRKISNVRLVNNAKGYLRYISKPTFISQKHFSKTFAAVLEITWNINNHEIFLVLSKPIYVRFTVLELSKYFMYDFHYNFVKKIIWCFVKIFLNIDIFLTLANINQFVLIQQTTKLLAKWTMNLKEFQLIQFIGLKAKMYCIFTENAEEANTAKGANISIEFKEY